MFIRKLIEDDLEAVWKLRLEAMLVSPEAFGSTYEAVLARGQESMRKQIIPSERSVYFGAFAEELVGMVCLVREEGAKFQHRGNIYAMYVSPNARGQGVGRALMETLIAEARQWSGLEQLHLGVVTVNQSAYRLYESLGFQTFAILYQGLKYGEQYWDEALMRLDLSAQ